MWLPARLNSWREKYLQRRRLTSAAKAASENKPLIAAVNRCATQKQRQHRVYPQPVKPRPFKTKSKTESFGKLLEPLSFLLLLDGNLRLRSGQALKPCSSGSYRNPSSCSILVSPVRTRAAWRALALDRGKHISAVENLSRAAMRTRRHSLAQRVPRPGCRLRPSSTTCRRVLRDCLRRATWRFKLPRESSCGNTFRRRPAKRKLSQR